MPNKSVSVIIENGYKNLLFEMPQKAQLSNNKSSIKCKKFVLDSISEMVATKRSKLHEK